LSTLLVAGQTATDPIVLDVLIKTPTGVSLHAVVMRPAPALGRSALALGVGATSAIFNMIGKAFVRRSDPEGSSRDCLTIDR
jgi:hypothetical protein